MSTIETFDQADALPVGAVLRTRRGPVAERATADPLSAWRFAGIFGPQNLYDTDLPATVLHDPTQPAPAEVTHRLERLDGTWLVEDVQEHTCGAGPGSGAGHEPGCGTIPLLDLRGLNGWDTLVAHVHQFEPAPAGVHATLTAYLANATALTGSSAEEIIAAVMAFSEPQPTTAGVHDREALERQIEEVTDSIRRHGGAGRAIPMESHTRTVAQVKAEALREAASTARAYSNGEHDNARHIASILDEKADELERGDGR